MEEVAVVIPVEDEVLRAHTIIMLHPTTSKVLDQWLMVSVIRRTALPPELTKPNRITSIKFPAIMGGLVSDEVDMGTGPWDPTKEAGGDPLKGPRALTPTPKKYI
jgi:hypothetical protein